MANNFTAITLNDLDFISREAYNVLRTNLAFSLPGKQGGKTIGITSSEPGDGKSYTSVNLALALAKDGQKVLLISADLRKSSLEEKLGIEVKVGLSNILAENTALSLDEIILISEEYPTLSIIGAGEIPPNPSALLGSEKMTEFVETVRGQYDYIIFDLPPVNSVIDPIAASKNFDGMIMVIRHGVTRKQSLSAAMRQLEYANVKILGFVYNEYSFSNSKYGYGKYGKYGRYGRYGRYYSKYYKNSYATSKNDKIGKEAKK